ncbi:MULTISPECIES: hypothetical protein [Burkholderia]|uniref:hypothetical protein n=1 Tax=Burkholderia TaxID=32008 RepID=UPI000F54B15E|nr:MULTISPECIES: hypothetical protein [Burkholderia]MBU9382874.1 hypothetical protein [Burkholderia gladioli]NIE85796.1 hypothetical protein [Burkholderia sp. Tr-860]NIF64592.1 hypothetical protein [Burkholderia sp. Cy-647]NIF95863.1 hypothetical protein [Burkholderia sp. Ax-1720]
MIYGLIFEKVGDINSLYPYICVYIQGESNPFMEIGVSEEKQLVLTFYENDKNVALSVEQWDEIARRGREFLPKAIADEDASM